MTSAFAVLLILTFALKTSTCDGVRPANYVPHDLIQIYYHLGLECTEIFLFLVFSHGISLSLRQLKRILKAKGLGQIRNARLFKLWKNTSEEVSK